MVRKPRFLEKVGRRRLFVDAAVDEVHKTQEFVVRERRVEEFVEVLERELQSAADEKGRLFETVVAAVTERDFGRFHFRDGPAVDVPDGLEVVQGIIEKRRDFVHVVFREKNPKVPQL